MEEKLEMMYLSKKWKQGFSIFKISENVRFMLKKFKRNWWRKY